MLVEELVGDRLTWRAKRAKRRASSSTTSSWRERDERESMVAVGAQLDGD
jgi:hypothetical protein